LLRIYQVFVNLLGKCGQISGLEQLSGAADDGLPCFPDMALLSRPLADGHPQDITAAQGCVGEEHFSRSVDPIEQLFVEGIQGFVVFPVIESETDQAERCRGHNLERLVPLHPASEELSQAEMLAEQGLKPRQPTLKLTFVAERPPPAQLAYQEFLVAAETSGEYFF
jgi:hypothetical protein